jgi:hypothetical protein
MHNNINGVLPSSIGEHVTINPLTVLLASVNTVMQNTAMEFVLTIGEHVTINSLTTLQASDNPVMQNTAMEIALTIGEHATINPLTTVHYRHLFTL